MFKKRRGISLPYKTQGLIYFMCVNFNIMPEWVQQGIRNACNKIAGDDSKALFEVLTNDSLSIDAIARKHYLNEKKLYRWRKEFYENAHESLLLPHKNERKK